MKMCFQCTSNAVHTARSEAGSRRLQRLRECAGDKGLWKSNN
jgi:hypothetical protein